MKISKRNCLDIETITEAVEQQTRLLRIERLNLAISILMKKNRNLLSVMQNRKPKKRCYYDDVNSDDGIEYDDKLMRTMTRAAMRKLSEKRKRLKQGREL